MTTIDAHCGTQKCQSFKIEVDDYGKPIPTNANEEEIKRAIDLLEETLCDCSFADDGHRNNDAVNSCIALHVLGHDPIVWFENFFDFNNKDHKFFNRDISLFMEHVQRVNGYLDQWGPEDNEGRALKFVLW